MSIVKSFNSKKEILKSVLQKETKQFNKSLISHYNKKASQDTTFLDRIIEDDIKRTIKLQREVFQKEFNKTLVVSHIIKKDLYKSVTEEVKNEPINSLNLNNIKEYDIIIFHNCLYNLDEIDLFLKKVKESCKPETLILGNLFGTENLLEMQYSFYKTDEERNRFFQWFMPRFDIKKTGMLLQACGFKGVCLNDIKEEKYYQSLTDILKDIRALNISNVFHNKRNGLIGKDYINRCEYYYKSNFTQDNDTLPLTYNIINFLAWS